MKKRNLKNGYDKSKSKFVFILDAMKDDEFNIIAKKDKDTYVLGPRWNEVEFPARTFNLLKKYFKLYKERDEGHTYTYWELK